MLKFIAWRLGSETTWTSCTDCCISCRQDRSRCVRHVRRHPRQRNDFTHVLSDLCSFPSLLKGIVKKESDSFYTQRRMQFPGFQFPGCDHSIPCWWEEAEKEDRLRKIVEIKNWSPCSKSITWAKGGFQTRKVGDKRGTTPFPFVSWLTWLIGVARVTTFARDLHDWKCVPVRIILVLVRVTVSLISSRL